MKYDLKQYPIVTVPLYLGSSVRWLLETSRRVTAWTAENWNLGLSFSFGLRRTAASMMCWSLIDVKHP